MKLRALTGFLDPGNPLEPERIEGLAAVIQACQEALEQAGYEVQTTRITTPPPSEIKRPLPPDQRPEYAQRLEAETFVHGLDYAALGPALPEETDAFAALPDILEATENVFTSGMVAHPQIGLSLAAARAFAQAIVSSATIAENGFANLRLTALANVPPGSPFFPAAYHDGGTPAVAIGTEGAELVQDAFREAPSLSTGRRRLVSMIEAHATAISRAVEPIAAEREVRFLGLDFSLAPYPDHLRSLGSAMEELGVPAVGLAGSAAAAAFIADSLDRANYKRTGFSGLFLPVLEDAALALRAADSSLTIQDLLLYSTLCGAGLDTIPLPGDTEPDALAAVLLDVGAIALRLDKPLTARLMPIPGKVAGDEVSFDFEYFADSKVMELPALPLTGLLASAGILDIGPRRG